MANTTRLAEVVALLTERDQDFRIFERAVAGETDEERLWSVQELKVAIGYSENENIEGVVNRAKIAADKAGMTIKEHFFAGDLFDHADDLYVTKYAALLILLNADPAKERVALAQSYFALLVDKQQLENEKRLRTRLDVATENRKLMGVAEDRGVQNFNIFNAVGVKALYGGLNPSDIAAYKGLPKSASYLDFANSEELAANLFRITQTAAALRRQETKSERAACSTHEKVAAGVRKAIITAGNLPPEKLPPAKDKIDSLTSKVKKSLGP